MESFDRGNSEKDENSEADEEVQVHDVSLIEACLLHNGCDVEMHSKF